ncbi:MAG: hypothetical protein HFJ75_07135 [Eggerthellaceae bacterium]|nr:hypothetical protein [Eggerthellaceae bacterium]
MSSPEAAFLQMALSLTRPALIALGSELCSGFSVAGASGDLVRRMPLSSAGDLGRFLARTRGCAGHRAASVAASYVVEGALSPPEVIAALLAGLPTRYGGYGLGIPLVNCDPSGMSRVEDIVAGGGRRLGTYVCDALWPRYGVALEYQGRDSHTEGSVARDAVRQARLGRAGINVVPLTHEQLFDARLFDEAMMALMGKAGLRWRCSVPDHRARHIALRRELRCLSTGEYGG